MKSFSQRQGVKEVAEVFQIGSMNDELRNSLWNALDLVFWSHHSFVYGTQYSDGEIIAFSRVLWAHHFKEPVDSRPGAGYSDRGVRILNEIRTRYFQYEWNEVYDFLDFIVSICLKEKPRLGNFLNETLEKELSGYRFVDGILTNITDAQEN